jgi:hypothetical protein
MSDVINAEYLGISKITNTSVISFNWIHADKKVKQWVAIIEGVCSKFGYRRKFLNHEWKPAPEKSGLASTLRAFRWVITPGHLYEYRNIMADYCSNHFVDGYFVAQPDGIITLDKEQVRAYLNMPIKDGKFISTPSFKPPTGNFVDDDIPF